MKTIPADVTQQTSRPILCMELPIERNQEIALDHWILSIHVPKIAQLAEAGQFVMIRPEPQRAALLARPFSIYRRHSGSIEILYKIYGKGTSELSQLKPGDRIKLWGPLGRGFRETPAKKWIFVAGGIGVAPFMILAQQAPASVEMVLLFGVRNKFQAILKNEFESERCQVFYAAEDASVGKKGFVTELLKEYLEAVQTRDLEIFTCGPRIMEREVSRIASEKKIPCQVAYEEYMGCGLGTCMGCVVKCRFNADAVYKRVCREGPVFMADEISWEPNE